MITVEEVQTVRIVQTSSFIFLATRLCRNGKNSFGNPCSSFRAQREI